MIVEGVVDALHEVAIARQVIGAVALDTAEDRERYATATGDLDVLDAFARRGERGVLGVARMWLSWATARGAEA